MDQEKPSYPLLSVVELSPVLIPYFLGFFIFRAFFHNFPLYLQLKQGLTDAETVELWAIISGAALFVGALSRLPAGLLSDRIGRFKAFILAYIIYIVSLLLVLQYETSILYILAISFMRLALNLIAMSGRGVVSLSLRDKGIKNGLLSSMVGLGSFAGPALMGYILENYPPDSIIYLSFVVIALDFTLFLIFLKVVPEFVKHRFVEELELDLRGIDRQDLNSLWNGLRRPGVAESFYLFFSAGMIYGLITAVYTIYGYNILGMSIDYLGLITGAGALVQTVWAPIVGKLYQMVRDEIMRLFAWSVLVIATICMVFSPSGTIFFILGYFVLNFGNASYFTMEITRLGQTVTRDEFSYVFGLATSLIILATAISGYISQFFYNISTEGTFFAALGFSSFSLIVVAITTPKWSKRRTHLQSD